MTKVTIVIRKDKMNKSNHAPIHFRIIKDRKVRYIATGLCIPLHHWDKKNKQVKSVVLNSSRINAFLTRRLADLQNLSLEQEIENPKSLSSKSLKALALGNQKTDFFEFAFEFIKSYASAGQIGTYDRFNATLNKLKKFSEKKRITLF